MSKIKYGKKNLTKSEDFEAKNAKERISIWIDESVVDAYRKRAKDEDTKYQVLMNQALKEFLQKPSLAQRIDKVEEQLRLLKTG